MFKKLLLVLLVILGLGLAVTLFSQPAVAQTYRQVDLSPGDVVQLGSHKFVKLTEDNIYLALASVWLCPRGSYVDGNNCQPCATGLDHCQACVSATACQVCEPGYLLEDFKCVPDCNQVTNCHTCDAPGQCSPTGCGSGYFTNAAGQCDSCASLDTNCTTCLNSATCSTCQTGYYPTGSTCTACSSSLAHCLACANFTTCSACETGYHLQDGNCVPDCGVANCSTCSLPNYCADSPSGCANGYYASGGNCLACSQAINGCSECSDDATCTTCRPGYTLEANGACTPAGSVNDCGVYSSPDVCDSCNSGYYLDANTCINCGNITTNCATCTNATASATLTCDSCVTGYTLNGETGNCDLNCQVANCQACSAPNYCEAGSCEIGYYSSGGSCLACTSMLEHCLNCSDGLTCASCEVGYHIQDGKCIPDCDQVSNCHSCASPNYCQTCAPGYTLNQGTCQVGCSVGNCLLCDAPSHCSSCASGYYPHAGSGNCYACSGIHPACLDCTDGTTCTTCAQGYYQNYGSCQSCGQSLPGCLLCQDGTTCTTCRAGYRLNSENQCQLDSQAVPHCDLYSTPELCLTCLEGYALVDNVCLKIPAPPAPVYTPPLIYNGASANISWSQVASASGYIVERSCNGEAWRSVANTPEASASVTFTDCSDPVQFRVKAYNTYLTVASAYAVGVSRSFAVCPTGCLECANAYVCMSCEPNYSLEGESCIKDCLVSRCTTCVAGDRSTCAACNPGYTLVNGKCLGCEVTNCQDCVLDDPYTCQTCKQDYTYDNATNTCVMNCYPANCDSCVVGEPNLCHTCSDGYGLSEHGCVPTGEVFDCVEFSSPGICAVCAGGFDLDPLTNTCVKGDPTLACEELVGEECLQCAAGYATYNGACYPIPAAPTALVMPELIYNDHLITLTWGSNSTSATNYVLERSCNHSAFVPVYSGSSLTTTNSTADCLAPIQFRVKAFNTFPEVQSGATASPARTYAPCIAGCTSCGSGSSCNVCQEGYYLISGVCEKQCTSADSQGILQEFTASDCAGYPTPLATKHTAIGCYTDARDGKVYEVRKFADGKCWLADNLRYGGVPDACDGQLPVEMSGSNLGICADPAMRDFAHCPAGSTRCGYHYDLKAATQLQFDPLLGQQMTFPAGIPTATNHLQGICPDGWHLASGGSGITNSELVALDIANGGTGLSRTNCNTPACMFFRPGQSFKTLYAHGSYIYHGWTYENPERMTIILPFPDWQYSTHSHKKFLADSAVSFDQYNYNATRLAASVRCVKNTQECPSHCQVCNEASACSACDEGYLLMGNTCWQQPAAPATLQVPTDIANALWVHVTWSSVTSDITGYALERSCAGGDWQEIYVGMDTTYNDSLLACTSPVRYRVKSVNGETAVASAHTPPSAPLVFNNCEGDYRRLGLACEQFCTPAQSIKTLQEFTANDCASLATPAPALYTSAGCYTDARDGKVYEVRKFADGKCWLADNLRYGGAVDACLGKTTLLSGSINNLSHRFGNNTYGDCRDPHAGGIVPCGAGQTACGYYYNWQAVMQLPSAYHDVNVWYPAGAPSTLNYHQGICPDGWHLPAGGDTALASDYLSLDLANGGEGVARTNSYTLASNFFQPGYGFKSLFVGSTNRSGVLSFQNSDVYWWSGTQANYFSSYVLLAKLGSIDPVHANFNFYSYSRIMKEHGSVVRCLKNATDCPSHCAACSSVSVCSECEEGFVLEDGVCYGLPAAPATVTVPDPAYNAQTITITWALVTDYASGYILERSCNEGEWERVYSGTALTTTNSLATCPGQAQYRVRAFNYREDFAGEYTYSAVVTYQACAAGCLTCTSALANTCTSCEAGLWFSGVSCEEPLCSANDAAGRTLQSFTASECDGLATPAPNGYTSGGCFIDERDNQPYEVRKFADGKCWLANNLRFGGGVSPNACDGKTTWQSGGNAATASNQFGVGTYGDCIDPHAGAGGLPCISGNTSCGYLYNWQGAMQLATAYYGAGNVTYPNGTPTLTNYHQGICPDGWHLPAGGGVAGVSEFMALDFANGGGGSDRSCDNYNAACNFFRPSGGFRALFHNKLTNARWWSSTQSSANHSYYLESTSTSLNPRNGDYKNAGNTVRCIKDAACHADCSVCESSACVECREGYMLANNACYQIPGQPGSITVPTTIYNAQTITISWGSVANAPSYLLERSCAGGEWVSVYAGSSNSTTNSVAGCSAPVKYRVKAYNNSQTIASDYLESPERTYAECASSCLTCTNSPTVCASCYDNYHVEGENNDANCYIDCQVPGCGRCATDDAHACQTCSSGYVLIGDACWSNAPGAATGLAMQDFTTAYCNGFAKPVALGSTLVGNLVDLRDNRSYEVRRLADGKCWMVDNLRYGGASDACADRGLGVFDGLGSVAPTNIFGAGTYGDCRDPAVGGIAPCLPGTTNCGYYYSWQAVLQLPDAFYNTTITYPHGDPSPANNYQGICPEGWHVPAGGDSVTTSEFIALDLANGGTGSNGQTGNSFTKFFKPSLPTGVTGSDPWKGIYAGRSGATGSSLDQGGATFLWSATSWNSVGSYGFKVEAASVHPQDVSDKYIGMSVRCVKD